MLIKGNAQFLFLLHLNSISGDFMLKNVNYVKSTENHLKISTEPTKIISKFFKIQLSLMLKLTWSQQSKGHTKVMLHISFK